MAAVWTRRAFLASASLLSRAEDRPTELRKFRDGATENEVVRLTDPQSASYLPPAHLRPVSRNNSVLFCSDRGSGMQAFRLDLKSGEFRPVSGSGVDVSTLTFSPSDSRIIYFQNDALTVAGSAGSRPRALHTVAAGWKRAPGFSISSDGRYAAFIEEGRGGMRIRLAPLVQGPAQTVIEAEQICAIQIRPSRQMMAYRIGQDYWLAGLQGQNKRKLALAPAATGPALWSRDGRSLLYLSYPDGKLNQLREHFPDTGDDKLIAQTSQFVSFARNSNATVFVGVSRNAGSPFVLLLLRVARREFTLCEHRASEPAAVPIVFSPDSSRIVFQTDRHGKPVIYSMVVDKLVEETLEDDATEPPRAERPQPPGKLAQ